MAALKLGFGFSFSLVVLTLSVSIAWAKPMSSSSAAKAVQCPDQGQGQAKSNTVELKPELETPESTGIICHGTVAAEGGLRVWELPTIYSKQVASLFDGQRVPFYGVTSGQRFKDNEWWWKVRIHRGYGWATEFYMTNITCS